MKTWIAANGLEVSVGPAGFNRCGERICNVVVYTKSGNRYAGQLVSRPLKRQVKVNHSKKIVGKRRIGGPS